MNDVIVFDDLLKKYRENKLAHAFLLETNDFESCYKDVLTFIKRINCPFSYNEQCEEDCNICSLIDNDSLPSLVSISPDGQFIKKDQVTGMMEKFSTVPVFTRFNVYIVNNAERFNSSSANSLLKFLEEPEENILGFFITNNKENVISTIRSRCQIYSCNYNVSISDSLNGDIINDVKLYLKSIYKNSDDLLYNRTHMSGYYKDRMEWEIFFTTMLYYLKDCYSKNCINEIDMLKDIKKDNIIKIIVLIENVLKYIKSNGNIDLILDKFVIEMRDYYE